MTDDFDHAYLELRPAALRAARSVLGDEAAAEDVVQDVFLHLWQRPSAYDPARGSLRAYVVMLTRSRAVDRWRAGAAHDAALNRAGGELRLVPQDSESCAEPVIRRDRRRRALEALATLPHEQRSAVLLACLGLSASEIAGHSGLPLGTAKSRLRLGLHKARSRLVDAADRERWPCEFAARTSRRGCPMNEVLSIRDVARRTGVPAGTLRMWESRYGFPVPQRLASGHRRYADADCDAIARVLAERERGLSLPAAIERVAATAPEPDPSLFATLRRARPDLAPQVLPKRALTALSHAIEDEYVARAELLLLFGAFQRVELLPRLRAPLARAGPDRRPGRRVRRLRARAHARARGL